MAPSICQQLHFRASKASKLSTQKKTYGCLRRLQVQPLLRLLLLRACGFSVSICAFVLVKQVN